MAKTKQKIEEIYMDSDYVDPRTLDRAVDSGLTPNRYRFYLNDMPYDVWALDYEEALQIFKGLEESTKDPSAESSVKAEPS